MLIDRMDRFCNVTYLCGYNENVVKMNVIKIDTTSFLTAPTIVKTHWKYFGGFKFQAFTLDSPFLAE